VIVCFGQSNPTYLITGACTGEWSPWIDRDDPTGSGDEELLTGYDDPCSNPMATQARIIDSTSSYTFELVSFSLAGLRCRNFAQLSGMCSDYEVRFCCGGITNLAVGDCTGQWTPWNDRDNPSGTGDWEMANLFTDDNICRYPVAAEARIIGTTSLTTTEVVSFSSAGLKCINGDQLSGSCSDYEIRFCCGDMAVGECTGSGQWSTWKNRDNPRLSGDSELLIWWFTDDDLCLDPVAAEARIVGTTSLSITENVDFSLAGLICNNADQLSGRCSDYEVRFCCVETTNLVVGVCTGQWSSWKDRDDPSGSGDSELLVDFTDDDLCLDPVAAQARIIDTTSLTTIEVVSFSLSGLSCVHSAQTSGSCSDYEIRFCCREITNLVVGDCTGQWSSWKDRDDPSSSGDYELLNLFTDDDICANPFAAEARIVGSAVLTTTENVFFSLAGLRCINRAQLVGVCSDYEVRFCCEERSRDDIIDIIRT